MVYQYRNEPKTTDPLTKVDGLHQVTFARDFVKKIHPCQPLMVAVIVTVLLVVIDG
jgi:hypothetical protein